MLKALHGLRAETRSLVSDFLFGLFDSTVSVKYPSDTDIRKLVKKSFSASPGASNPESSRFRELKDPAECRASYHISRMVLKTSHTANSLRPLRTHLVHSLLTMTTLSIRWT